MADPSTHSAPRQLKFLVAFAFVATIGMWGNLAYYSWFAAPLGWTYPDNTFQFLQVARFSDFYDMVEANRGLDPYRVGPRGPWGLPGARKPAYPPLAEVFYHPFSFLIGNYDGLNAAGVRKAQDIALWLFLGVPFCAFPILASKWLNAKNAPAGGGESPGAFGSALPWLTAFLVLVGFNLAYPMIFTIDRGNLELYTAILITLFAWWMNDPSPLRRNLAVAAVGAAAALKIYPLIFVLIYLKQRRWRAALGAVFFAAVLSLAGFLLLDGGLVRNVIAHWHLVQALAKHNSEDIAWATHYSSSLFSLIYLSLRAVFHRANAAQWFQFHSAPFLWSFAVLVAVILLLRRLSFARLLLGVCGLAILAAPESPDYKLLLLYPAAIAVIAEGGGTRIFNLLFVAFMGLLLVPKNWILIFADVSYSSIFNPLLVLGLLALAVAAPAPNAGSADARSN